MENIEALIISVKAQSSFTNATDHIYAQYSNFIQNDVKVKVNLSIGDESVVFDKGWYYNNNGENYFKRTGKYLLKKGTEFVTVNPEEFIKDYKNTENLKFTAVSIQIKKHERTSSWIWLNGDKYLGFNNRLRFYFSFEKTNVEQVIEFIKELGTLLDLKELPYKIKIEESISSRNENAVLYFNKSDYYIVFMIVHYLYNEHRDKGIFRDGGFVFVKTFNKFKGLAFAEDPNGTNASFGETIANLYARAILHGNISNENDLKKYVQKQGYDFERLYLNPNTNFDYRFTLFENDKNTANGFMVIENELKKNETVKMIHKIAMIIVKNAVIYQNKGKTKCDWLKTVFDKIWKEETDCYLCDDNEKIEILEFLAVYLSFSPSIHKSDQIVLRISTLAYNTIKPRKLSEDFKKKRNKIRKMLDSGFGGQGNTPKLLFEQLQNSNPVMVQNALNTIKYNLDERGIVSYLPDDEFNPTQKDYGYAYLGMILLKQLREAQA